MVLWCMVSGSGWGGFVVGGSWVEFGFVEVEVVEGFVGWGGVE